MSVQDRFLEDYNALKSPEKDQFKKVINSLLFHCYIIRKKYDRASRMDRFTPEYAFIEKHWELFNNYLSFMDMILSRDDDSGVIFVRSEEDRNTVRFNTATTLVVYALRTHYETELEKRSSTQEVPMDANLLRQYLSDLGLSSPTKRLSLDQISQALKTLQTFNVVTLNKGSFNDTNYSFYILPSIRFVINRERMNALYRYVSGETAEEEPLTDTPAESDEPEAEETEQAQTPTEEASEAGEATEPEAEEARPENEAEAETDAVDDDDPEPEGF